jgi:hypothetical protein
VDPLLTGVGGSLPLVMALVDGVGGWCWLPLIVNHFHGILFSVACLLSGGKANTKGLFNQIRRPKC